MSLMHTEIAGIEFNKTYKDNTKFYKFLKNDLTHYGFQYKLGLNIDVFPFNPTNECSQRGLYFCAESKCHLFWKRYGTLLAFIEIPNDARVYIEQDKFKSDKIIIKEIIKFEDVSDDFWINILQKDISALYYVKNPSISLTEEMCKSAVKRNGKALCYVHNQTEEICILAVQRDCMALEYVNEQFKTKEICEIAVKQNGNALQFIKEENQTEEICRLAVTQDCRALRYVKYQSEDNMPELSMSETDSEFNNNESTL